MTSAKRAVWLFAAVSTISFIAAFIPLFRGGVPNVVFLGSGTVFLIVAIGSARKARSESGVPPTA